MLRTPNEELWPGVTQLPDFKVILPDGEKSIIVVSFSCVEKLLALFQLLVSADLPQLVDYELEGIDEEAGDYWTGPVGPDAGDHSLLSNQI